MCRSCGPEDGGLSLAEVTSSSGADARGRRDTAAPRPHTPPPRSLGDGGDGEAARGAPTASGTSQKYHNNTASSAPRARFGAGAATSS